MKNDWTEIVKDKLEESTVTPPSDLWAGISSDLDAVMPVQPVFRSMNVKRWFIAAACLASIVICGIFLAVNNRPTIDTSSVMLADNGKVLSKENKTADDEVVLPEKSHTNKPTPNIPKQQNKFSEKTTDTVIVQEEVPKILETVPDSDIIVSSDTIIATDSVVPVTEHVQLLANNTASYVDEYKHDLGHVNRFSVGFYASNIDMPSLSDALYCAANEDFASDVNDNMSSSDNSPGSIITPSINDVKIKDADHKQPQRLGMSVRLPLSEELSVSSGIVYSRLSSSLTWEYNGIKILNTDQTLNYLGIPLSIEYNLPTYRLAAFYLTAGAMVEKCIYGESTVANPFKTERVSEKNLQLSMFAGVGLQLNLNRHISLYAEPLVTFYIDNHSDIVNIYKDRKTNFDLRVGLRYTFK